MARRLRGTWVKTRTVGTLFVTIHTQTGHHYRTDSIQSPIDDQLYDLLQTLTSKCEAIETYAKYEDDATGDAKQVFQEIARDDIRHAQRLLEVLKTQLKS